MAAKRDRDWEGGHWVYVTDWKSEADEIVYVTDWLQEADMIVYETEFKNMADKIVYVTDYKPEASYLIYKSKNTSDAGRVFPGMWMHRSRTRQKAAGMPHKWKYKP